SPGLGPLLGYFIIVLLMNVFIYWLNQRAVKTSLLPLKRELESLLHSIETGEPFEPTEGSNQRTYDFAMKAAARARPVEFKVAFWQLAVFGVPGIVGIWFFWMLGKTEGNIPQIFIPHRLIWGALSILGGLIYTWLIQRTVRRAVGISTLGIHLQNGMSLIRWDDIKEVRPFKFLHVRNLWLIRESGEKTLMHWTPLDRHSDLKAAVEGCAPAEHPIRQYLSLLRTKPTWKDIMIRIILIGAVLLALGAIVFAAESRSKPVAMAYSDPVSQMLETIRVKHHFPALAAAVVVDGKIVVTNAVGFRKEGGPEQITVDDKFHLGSVTKSMTATVAAMLVEQGTISWTKTIGEAFPEFKGEIHPDYLGVTLEQLLSHRGGAPGDAPGDLWRDAWMAKGTAAEQRLAFIKGLLARKPESKPGTKFTYSNQGYTIAGVMLEKADSKAWEELLRSMLFEPLGMTNAGFGAPASVGKVDQPWGHNKSLLSGVEPVPPGPRADNPLAISPAGAVHCSIGDLAKYAAFHMAGERGESKLLKADSFRKLHTVAEGNKDYALGWLVLNRPWANGRALMHNGSNTMF
ncbi:MAG TPA: serine hydrolase domain-containing protein, partial [Roseimicrobium sp.]|nr:serine hydrolase domain-containing protein [Roseimicrobium sp.]